MGKKLLFAVFAFAVVDSWGSANPDLLERIYSGAESAVAAGAAAAVECHEDALVNSRGETIGTLPHCEPSPLVEARN